MQETVIFGFKPWHHASRTGTGLYEAAAPAVPGRCGSRIYEVFQLICSR